MKKTLTWITKICVVAIILMNVPTVLHGACPYSGVCGATGDSTNVSWELTCHGVLYLQGSGAMADYEVYQTGEGVFNDPTPAPGRDSGNLRRASGQTYAPWYAHKEEIKVIHIAEGITYIGANAFYECSSVDSMICAPVTPPTLGTDAFYGVSNTIPVYVPSESVEVYQSDEGWRSFTNIRAIDGNTTGGTSDTIRLYCRVTQAWWTTEDAAVGLYAYAEGDIANAAWPGSRMSKVEGQDGLWMADVDRSLYTSLIFTRVSGTGTIEDWGAKTADLLLPSDGMNLYTITSTEAVWGDPGVTGEWSYYDGTTGTGGVTITSYSLVGDSALFGGVNWDVTNEATNMTQTGDFTWMYTLDSVYLKAYRNYEYKVVANHTWGVSDYPSSDGNYSLAVEQSGIYRVTFTFETSVGCTPNAELIRADESGGENTNYSNYAAVINLERMVQFVFSGTDEDDMSQYEAHVQLNQGDTLYIRDRSHNVMLEFTVEEYGAYTNFTYTNSGSNYDKIAYVVCQQSGCYDLFYKSNYSLYLGEGTDGCSEGEPYDEGSMQTAHVSLTCDYGYVYINDNVSSGDFVLGSTITLSAQPYSNYQFLEWSDGNYANPRQFVVTGDTTIKASFGSKDIYPTGILINRKKFIRSTFNDGTQLIVRANIAEGDTVELYFINDNIFWMAPVEQYGAYQNFSGGEADGHLICNVAGCYDIYFKLEDGLTQSIYIGEGTQCFDGEEWVSPIQITQEVCYLIGKNDNLGAWNLAQAQPINKDGTTITLPAGMYQFKLLPQNDSWENSYGSMYIYARCSSPEITSDADGNIVIALAEESDITISFGDYGICLTGNFVQANTNVHLTTGASPEEAGTVSVESGDYLIETELTLSAYPATGWELDKWSDGVVQFPRKIKLTQDTTLMAEFTPGEFGIIINRRQLSRSTYTGRLNNSYIAQFKSSVNLEQGDKIQLINLLHGENNTWLPDLEDGGLSANFSIHESDEQQHLSLVCNIAGCYDIYSKIHYGQSNDVLYIGAGEDCLPTEYFPIDLTDSITGYSVVGTANLFGTAWDVSDRKTEMSLSSTGIYIYTLDSVTLMPDSIYQYKVIANHAWNVDEYPSIEGGDNYYISVQAAGVYSVTFTLTQGVRAGAAINYLHAIQTDCTPTSGICGAQGDNITWVLSCDSILFIRGTGAMADYYDPSSPYSGGDIGGGMNPDPGLAPRRSNINKSRKALPTDYAPWLTYSQSIKKIRIEESVTRVGANAFNGCSTTKAVTLPSTLQSVGEFAFNYLISLDTLTCGAATPPTTEANSFYDVNSAATLQVPTESVSAYQAADGWKSFAKIQAIGSNATSAQARIFAYNLGMSYDASAYIFTFTANIAPTAASLIFYDAETSTAISEIPVPQPTIGANSIAISQGDLPSHGQMTWAVKLQADPVTEFSVIHTGEALMKCHLAIDNSPESDYFGRIYIANRQSSGTGGIYVYNPDYSLLASNAQGGQEKWQSMGRPAVGADGTVYIADWGDAHGGIYVMNPASLNASAFFVGTQGSDGLWTNSLGEAMGSSTAAVAVYGEGENTILYAMNEDQSTAGTTLYEHGVNVYHIGQHDGTLLTEWNTVPTLTFALQDNSAQMFAINPNDYGAFFSCSRAAGSNISGARSLQFYNTAGERTFVALPEGATADLTGSLGGGSALSRDNSQLAIVNGEGNVLLYAITWTGDTPSLSLIATYATEYNAIASMAFDYAGNLLVTAGSGYNNTIPNTFVVYGMPTDNNECIVPAKKSLVITNGCNPVSGNCGAEGDNLIWTFTCDSMLTISGTGAMANYNGSSEVPWHDYQTAIRTAIISEGVTSLSSSSTFENCTALESVVIPEGITSLGMYTFGDCSSLKAVDLPSTLTSLGSYCFTNCWAIESIICRATTPPEANGSSLSGVNYMIPIYVPAGTTDQYLGADGWSGFTDYRDIIDGCVVASGECGAEGDNLMWILYCDSVMTIRGTGAMENYSINSDGQAPWAEHGLDIRDIVIEEGVRTIGSYAFYNAGSYTNGSYNNVRSITIPSTVTKLQNNNFYQCPVQTVTLNSDSIVGQTSYSSSASLHKIFGAQVRQYIIGDSVKQIANSAFYNQSADSIKSILLPEGLTSIGSWAFGYLENLDSITLPRSLQSIGSDAFYGSGLRAITIPGSVTDMGGQAFQNCDKLASVTLEEGLTSLGTSAFQNCTALTEITIPESMVTIKSGAFTDCTHLTKMTILATEWVGADKSSSSTTKQAIGNYVRELILGDHIPTIGKYAFSSLDSLRIVTLPSNVTSISSYAFSSCSSLTCVISNALTPPTIQTNTFSRQDTLIVPCESKQLYKTAQYWQNFNRIKCADDYEMSIGLTGNWTFIMLPATFGMEAGDVTTEGEVLWGTYNGSVRAMGRSGWENYSSDAVHMCSQALIVRATGDTATLIFNVPQQAWNMAETTIALFQYSSNHEENANWNFIGNPYPYPYDVLNALAAAGIEAPVTIWNGTGYETLTPGLDNHIFQPFEALFIQLPMTDAPEWFRFTPQYIVQ